MKRFIVCSLLVFSWVGASAQMARIHEPPIVFGAPMYVAKEIDVSLEPLDSSSLAFGLRSVEVNDVLKLSVESTGWELRSGADHVISVKLTPLAQRQEDLFAFQIDVSVGTQERSVQEGSGGLSASSVVEVPADGNVKLLAQIYQLVTKVSRRLRQEIMRRSFDQSRSRQSPEQFRGDPNRQLSDH